MASREEKAKKEPSLMLMSAMNFISGTVGGGCEAVVGYPLETIKARMQTQKATTAAAFSGPLDCLQKSIRHEGISSLYRGATPQIFRSAVSASLLFGLVGQFRYLYTRHLFQDRPPYGLIAATISTGLTESILYTPFEIIKIRMQTAKTPMTNWQCIKQVYHQNGLQGLYRGFIPTAKREMVGNTVYFLAYETAKKTLIERFVENDKSLTPEAATKRSYQCIGLSGGFAGFAYWLVVFPVDTVKSVMQADRLHDPRYSGVLDCCRQLYVEGNISRFYRGISPSLLRAFSANAVTFVAFESCYSFLHEIWT